MTVILEKYAGREQSYIKHRFLTEYLKAAAYKTLQGRSPTFNFVDAFAGPWRVSDQQDYSDASFDQALRTLEAVRADLERRGVLGLKIRFCFCERRAQAVNELREYASRHGEFDINIFHGPFEDHLDEISSVCEKGFTFTFIDPTGWDIRSAPIFDFLRAQKGEFVLNFMSEHINRHAEYSRVSESFGRFLADPEWADDYEKLPMEWSNEERVLRILEGQIKQSRAATYVPNFPILKPREDRVKMRLLLGTHSERGVEVFRDVQGNVEKTEIETRNSLRDSNQYQASLFSDDEIAEMQRNAAGIGCPLFQGQAERFVIEYLSNRKDVRFSSIATATLEAIPIRLTQFKDLLNAMRENSKINYELPPRKQKPQPKTKISLVKK